MEWGLGVVHTLLILRQGGRSLGRYFFDMLLLALGERGVLRDDYGVFCRYTSFPFFFSLGPGFLMTG